MFKPLFIDRVSLAKAIAESELNAARLAMAIGRGKDYINDYLTGRKGTLKPRDWQKIAEKLSLRLVIDYEDDPLADPIRKFRAAPAPIQLKIIGYIDAMASGGDPPHSGAGSSALPPEAALTPAERQTDEARAGRRLVRGSQGQPRNLDQITETLRPARPEAPRSSAKPKRPRGVQTKT